MLLIKLVMTLRIVLLISVEGECHCTSSIRDGSAVLRVMAGTLIVEKLRRFFIAIARALVNEDGRDWTVVHPTVWSSGGELKKKESCAVGWGVCLGSWASWSLALWYSSLSSY